MYSSQSQPEFKKDANRGDSQQPPSFLNKSNSTAEQSFEEFKKLAIANNQRNSKGFSYGDENMCEDEFLFKLPKNRWYFLKSEGTVYTPRTGHTVSTIDHYLYLFGGIDIDVKKNLNFSNSLFIFFLSTKIFLKQGKNKLFLNN